MSHTYVFGQELNVTVTVQADSEEVAEQLADELVSQLILDSIASEQVLLSTTDTHGLDLIDIERNTLVTQGTTPEP